MKRWVMIFAVALGGCAHTEPAARAETVHASSESAEAVVAPALEEELDDGCGVDTSAPPFTSGGAVAALGSHLYWIGGSDGAPNRLARRFDVRRRRWQTFPQPRHAGVHPIAVATSQSLVLAGGAPSVTSNSDAIERFDPQTCSWSQEPARLPWAPSAGAGAGLGDEVALIGGNVTNRAGSLYDTEIWTSDAAVLLAAGGRLRSLPPLPTPRSHAAAVSVRGELWVIGGHAHRREEGPDGGGATDVVEILAPGATAWTAGPRLRAPAEVVGVVLGDDTIVVLGTSVLFSRRPMILERGADRWRQAEPRDPRLEFLEGAAVVDDVVYVIAKQLHSPGDRETLYVATYDPRGDAWEIVSEVGEAR